MIRKADMSTSAPAHTSETRYLLSRRRGSTRSRLFDGRRGWHVVVALIVGLFCSVAARANTYYLAPNGSDGNSGQSLSAAWLTPNHSVNCGDVIIAEAGTYNNAYFYTGRWGTVNCSAGNNVAWLKCATFDACKIYATNNQGMWVDKSYWGIQGWEVSTSASDTYGACFNIQPNYSNPVEIHHVIFANDVANGCAEGGFVASNRGDASSDYIAVLGSVAYNTSQGSGSCASGISIYQPVPSDSASGTHIYIAGNFAYANLEPSRCGGGSSTDGEGIILDTFDGSQGGLPSPYWAQAAVYNNIVFANGLKGIEVNHNSAGSSHAYIYIDQNTVYGDFTDKNQSLLGCGEIQIVGALNTKAYSNLVATNSASGCGGNPIYAVALATLDNSDQVDYNFVSGVGGNNTFTYDTGSFAFGSHNTYGSSPSFANTSVPGAPSCGKNANVPSCMASVIANLKPGNQTAKYTGYQPVSSSSVYDALFPRWLCNVNLPSGLVTMGCNTSQ